MSPTLFVTAFLGAVAAALYGYVGVHVWRRTTEGEMRAANQMFALWWMTLAGISVSGAAFHMAAGIGVTNVSFYSTFFLTTLFVSCLSLWALGYYLVFLYTGRSTALVPLAVLYLGNFIFLLYLVQQANPVGVEVGRWSVQMVFESDQYGGQVARWLMLELLAPQVIGALVFMALFFEVKDSTYRFRVALVGFAILFWGGSAVFSTLLGVNRADTWGFAAQVIGFAAATVVVLAYDPPTWLRSRLGIQPLPSIGQ